MTLHHQLRLVAPPSAQPVTKLLDGVVIFPALGSTPLVAPEGDDLSLHLMRYGDRPVMQGSEGLALITRMHDVGLTGRGGGHFPTGRKWESVRRAGPGVIAVANGAEGEPASGKDAALLQQRPHLVVDGLVCAAEAVGASECVVWLHRGAHRTRSVLERALHDRVARGLIEPRIRIELGPDRYLTGEATAVMQALAGGPALPQMARNPAVPWGDGHRPILVNNVETLARTAILARTEVGEYRRTSLVTVVNHDTRIVCEADPWEKVADLVGAHWRSPSGVGFDAPQAILLGGYGGSWVPWFDAAGLDVDPDALRSHGLSIGAGVIAPLPSDACGIAEAASLVSYLSDSSARQCGPCLFGLAAVAELMADLASGSMGRAEHRRLDRFLGDIVGRGACKHPDGAVRMLSSAFSAFAEDVHSHRTRGHCLVTTRAANSSTVLPIPVRA